eukprot:452407-Pelagomonas_calceolata.AAC.2
MRDGLETNSDGRGNDVHRERYAQRWEMVPETSKWASDEQWKDVDREGHAQGREWALTHAGEPVMGKGGCTRKRDGLDIRGWASDGKSLMGRALHDAASCICGASAPPA